MSWLPWTLDYTKRGMEAAIDKAAAAKKTAKADHAPHRGHSKKEEPITRASMDQYNEAIRKLTSEGFTDIHLPRNGAYFSQTDDRWSMFPYPKVHPEKKPRYLKDGGCGPTSLAIAIATLRPNSTMTPREVGDFAVKKGLSSPKNNGRGTNMAIVKLLTEEQGLVSDRIDDKEPDKIDQVREGVKNGGVAVVHVRPGVFNYPRGHPERKPEGGHWIAVNGYAVDDKGNEWFFVANPGKDASAETVEKDELFVDRELQHHGAGMVRVSRETLERLMQESYLVTDPAAKPSQEATPGG